MAWNAEDILEARAEYPTLDAALADTVLVAGTTSAPPKGHAVFSPRDLAPRLLDAAGGGTVALVFGRENLGLTREDLARCQVFGIIPSSPGYASLNLAQAALIFLYEIRLAALARDGATTATPERAAPLPRGLAGADAPPTQAEIEGFYRRLTESLDAIGFFAPGARARMSRDLRRIFNRALLTRRELRILEGIVRRVDSRRAGAPVAPSNP
jgi:TrmH family RNA methyltransferase